MVKRLFFAVLLTAICFFVSAQEVNEVTLVVSGEGTTKEEATHAALRSAIEQAFGVFVSANTAILNDEIVKDEIATVSSGNIQKYKELGYNTLSNGNTTVSLEATVSIGKLVSYVKSKGAECEFAGATFGANIKLLKLKYDNSKRACMNLIQYIKDVGPSVFTKSIAVGEPDLRSEERGKVKLELTISYDSNENTFTFYRYVASTLMAISLTEEEADKLYDLSGDYPLEHHEPFGYVPNCGRNKTYEKNGVGHSYFKSVVFDYCLLPIISTNLGQIKLYSDYPTGTSSEYFAFQTGVQYIRESGNPGHYNPEYCTPIRILLRRMFDCYMYNEEESPSKTKYFKEGFYEFNEDNRFNENYISVGYATYNEKYYVAKDNKGIGIGIGSPGERPHWKADDEIVIDGYYQIPLPYIEYSFVTTVDKLEKITGFFVK